MWEKTLGFGVEIPFVELLGFELIAFADGRSEIHYPPKPAHLNSFNVTHGGALMTLLDVSMASAARSVSPDLGVVTIEKKPSFMHRAVPSPDVPLVARGELMHRTATMAFTQATVFDAQGKACAHATGTFKYVKRLATGSESVTALHAAPGTLSTD
ncbi:MAG: PaaI family thioesterase [Candidatus Saccharibacteria bacterium]|nr:PaaI family thioesterase [Rhodoferax sp.]